MLSSSRLRHYQLPEDGFTVLEVLITLAILLVILVSLMKFMTEVDQAWKTAAADPFAEAQEAFNSITENLSNATLAPYLDYADVSGSFCTNSAFVPDHLARRSDLDFVCGPSEGASGLLSTNGLTTAGSGVFFLEPNGYTQTYAHMGLERLLNAMGYFVVFGDDTTTPGFILPQTHCWRWRLKQIHQQSESLQIFANKTSSTWIQQLISSNGNLAVLAENVVTLIVLPERAANDSGPSLAPSFSYDSRDTGNLLTLHQLPPRARLILVAMDEASAKRLAVQNGMNAPQLVPSGLFQETGQTDAAQQTAQLDADLATLDSSLTTQKIGHRIFQREILLSSSNWSNMPSP